MTGLLPLAAGLDYGSTLTNKASPYDLNIGMRPVDPRVLPVLYRMHEAGISLVLASNTRPDQDRRIALQQAGILHLFAVILESARLGVAKPAEVFYRLVEAAAGVPPRQVVFIGNNMKHDVEGPLRYGMQAVLVKQPDSQNPVQDPAKLGPDDPEMRASSLGVPVIPNLSHLFDVIPLLK
ncbi:HAD family hydrolase [Streptosporangium saharense]|uniref:HAD family hydrolase n=1 Tax=Streptosporangium saharense TaxID=1706840 RepID=UPI0036861B0D